MSDLSTTTPRPLRFAQLPPFPLECGEQLRHATVAYHLDGELNAARDNVILVLHALTGTSDAVGDWWKGVVGPGCARVQVAADMDFNRVTQTSDDFDPERRVVRSNTSSTASAKRPR